MKIFRLIYKSIVLKESKDDSFDSYNDLINEKLKLKSNNPEYTELLKNKIYHEKCLYDINNKLKNLYTIELYDTNVR